MTNLDITLCGTLIVHALALLFLDAGVFLGARVHSRTQWYSCGTSDNWDQRHKYSWTGTWWDCVPTLHHCGRCELVYSYPLQFNIGIVKVDCRILCQGYLSPAFPAFLRPGRTFWTLSLYGVTLRVVYEEQINIRDWYYTKQLKGWEQ